MKFQPISNFRTDRQYLLSICSSAYGLTLQCGFMHEGYFNPDWGLGGEPAAVENMSEADTPVAWSHYPDLPPWVFFEDLTEKAKGAFSDMQTSDPGQWIDLRIGKVGIPDASRAFIGLISTSDGITLVPVVAVDGVATKADSGSIIADTMRVFDDNTKLLAMHPLPAPGELAELVASLNEEATV